jgi:DNA-binding CsgD family transcriptional regulator
MLRNAGIIFLIFISGLALWLLNRRRKKAIRLNATAQKQLHAFREEMIVRNQQIETIMSEIHNQEHSKEKAGRVEELSGQIILTEDDWLRFQSLFNKTYPGYLHRLKEKVAGITEAEIRMACLIKIQLNTRQIASMQGISPDSVHKTRHRLRQRFSTATTTELESILASV